MSFKYKYIMPKLIDLLQIKQIHEQAKSQFQETRGFSPKGSQMGVFEPKGNLPALSDTNGIQFGETRIEGYLSLKHDTISVFRHMIQTAGDTIGSFAALAFNIGFEENTSEQSKRYHDDITIRIIRGKSYIEYTVCGKRGEKNIEALFLELIQLIDIPMVITIKDNDYFLSPANNEELWTSLKGINEESPGIFRCEMPGVSPEELLERVQFALSKIATTKRFEFSWSTYIPLPATDEQKIQDSKKINELLSEYQFPAERYFIDTSFTMDSLDGLETVRALCGPKDKVFTHLFTLSLPDENYANVEVETSSEGHKLLMDARMPVDLGEINRKLGTEFRAK